jgi:hypothetical protein
MLVLRLCSSPTFASREALLHGAIEKPQGMINAKILFLISPGSEERRGMPHVSAVDA